MITDEQLQLIELTLEEPVDDLNELAQRAISLHGHCAALLAEVKRQQTLLGMGVRIVGKGRPVPSLDELDAVIMTSWQHQHGQLCPRWTGRDKPRPGACNCWIAGHVRKVSAAVQGLLIERGEHVAAAEPDASVDRHTTEQS